MVRVKICGITNLDDAVAAVENGADELGFNFYPRSPRFLSLPLARKIAARVSNSVELVGVFVNAASEDICRIADHLCLDAIQLHGDEPAEMIVEIASLTGKRVIKAVRDAPNAREAEQLRAAGIDVLMDASTFHAYGGTGTLADWSQARETALVFDRMYLAGGLGPDNIANAIRTVRPFSVDACSRLEIRNGKKDPQKVADFIKAAKNTIL